MKKGSKFLLLVSSLILVGSFFLPLWTIALKAPQYPEGLSMNIWLNKITGDLKIINDLNHYIGMKEIEPDSIPELKVMPFIIIFLMILGLINFFTGNKKLVYIWVGLFILLGIVGLYDFYLWEYDYGHNLNPNAAIKIPGMSYQPPLIGTKQLLNFHVASYPSFGFVIIVISIILAIIYLILNRNVSKVKE